MAPCHSITTALYALESLSLPMELSRALASIPLLQTINKDSAMYLLLLQGTGISRVTSLSSYQRFVYIPSWLLAVEQCVYAEHASFRDQGIQMLLCTAMWIQEQVHKLYCFRDVLPRYCCRAEVEGRRYRLAFIRFQSHEILLNCKYRQLRATLHNWSWSFSPPSVTSTEVLWDRKLLQRRIRHCLGVWSDRVQGCNLLEWKRGSSHGSLDQSLLTVLSGCWTTKSSEDHIQSRRLLTESCR